MQFKSEAQISRLTQGFINRSLPKEAWTYSSFCAAAIYIHLRRPELSLYRDFPDLIMAYNNAVGIENSDVSGYHETMTQFFIQTLRWFLDGPAKHLSPLEAVNGFLNSDYGKRDYPLKWYTKKRLFSPLARRCFLPPDRALTFDPYKNRQAA